MSKCNIELTTQNRPQHRIKRYNTSAERSLLNLCTDYLDCLLIHRSDPLMDADEVAEVFSALQLAGKVRYFAVSNFSPSQFDLLSSHFPLATNQVECSLPQMSPLYDGALVKPCVCLVASL